MFIDLHPAVMVMIGFGFTALAFIFYCVWDKYSKAWKRLLILCAIYSWCLGTFTEWTGFIAIFCPELLQTLIKDGFEAWLITSSIALVGLWWAPWFKKNWRKVLKDAKKSGYL